MAEATLTVTYDGPALESHRMDVRELAPALLALADALQESNEILEPGAPPVTLDISATDEGSFLINLILVRPDLPGRLVDMFSGDSATALANLLGIFGGATGLLAFIKHAAGRQVRNMTRADEAGNTTVTFEDGTSVTYPSSTVRLYRSFKVRRHVQRFVEPLGSDGVDAVKVKSETIEEIEITDSDRPAFEIGAPPATPPIVDQVTPMAVSLASVAFSDGNKWRLSDGERTFWATMADQSFQARIDQGEPFRKGDILRADMRIVQTRDSDGLHTEWTVERVTEHVPASVDVQLEIPELDSPE